MNSLELKLHFDELREKLYEEHGDSLLKDPSIFDSPESFENFLRQARREKRMEKLFDHPIVKSVCKGAYFLYANWYIG